MHIWLPEGRVQRSCASRLLLVIQTCLWFGQMWSSVVPLLLMGRELSGAVRMFQWRGFVFVKRRRYFYFFKLKSLLWSHHPMYGSLSLKPYSWDIFLYAICIRCLQHTYPHWLLTPCCRAPRATAWYGGNSASPPTMLCRGLSGRGCSCPG